MSRSLQNWLRGVMVILVVTCGALTGCTPRGSGVGGANDGAGGNNNSGEPSNVTGFFNDDEAWLIGSETVLLAGHAGEAEFSVLASDDDNETCLGWMPEASLQYDGQDLNIASQYMTGEPARACGLTASGGAVICAPGRTLSPPSECELSDETGAVNIAGNESGLGRMRVLRFSECTNLPESIEDASMFAISNLHPFAQLFLDDTASVGGLVLVASEGTESPGLVATSSTNDSYVGCGDQTPEGTINWNGSTLEVSLTLTGRDNDERSGSEGTCTISFSGNRAYCANVDPADFGGTGTPSQLLLFKGTGQYTFNEVRAEYPWMYLLLGEAEMGGNGGGGVRVKQFIDRGAITTVPK